MKKPSSKKIDDIDQFYSLIGLGDLSVRKTYYPALQKTIEDLENEKEKFERIFSNALSGIFQTTVDGQMIIANPAMAEICAYDSPELLVASVRDMGSQLFNKITEYNRFIAKLRNDKVVINFESEFKKRNNELIIVSMNARLNVFFGNEYIEFFLQDITERKKNEEELIKHREHLEDLVKKRTIEIEKAHQSLIDSEERFRSLSEASFEGIVIIEGSKIIEANDTIATMVGYKLSDLMGMSVERFICPDDKVNVKSKIMSGHEKPLESTCLKKDGSTFPVEIHARKFIYKGRQVRVLAIRDISEKLKAETEINKLRGILPICASCKKIRDDQGYWNQIEAYIQEHSDAEFTHGICPNCAKKLYPRHIENKQE